MKSRILDMDIPMFLDLNIEMLRLEYRVFKQNCRDFFFTINNIKCTFLNFLLKNQKQVIDIHVKQLFIQ